MSKQIPDRWRRASGHFTTVFQRLVEHRGLTAERELIDSLGLNRVKALNAGAEPQLGELIEAARILDVPLSTFQIHERGGFSELEVVIAELMYAASDMDARQRLRLIEELAALAGRIKSRDCEALEDEAELPDSLLAIIRGASDT